jgi:ribonuclease BN (tRNA processing enzyme)
MKLKILGCSGGIGGDLRTTSMLLDHDVLIDAGTGVSDLSIGELALIDHVFITHAHMDHVTSIPFIVDTVGWMRSKPLTIYATAETIDILKTHLFNWKLWPDFSQIPDTTNPSLQYQEISVGRPVSVGGRKITALPANHVVPAVGFLIDSGKRSLAFTGDTTSSDALWRAVNEVSNLGYLIVETALSDRERELAVASKHLCPSLLAAELGKLKLTPEIYITHLKPREAELIMEEIATRVPERRPQMLQVNHVFDL